MSLQETDCNPQQIVKELYEVLKTSSHVGKYNLLVLETAEAIIIEGSVDTFYQKQIVAHLVVKHLKSRYGDKFEFVNEVRVRKS